MNRKSCAYCKHIESEIYKEPCRDCYHWRNFEPKEHKEENPKNE